MASDHKIRDEIEFLSAASRQELLAKWQGLFRTPAPAQLSTPLLRRGVIYQVQVVAFGGLLPQHKRALFQAAGSKRTTPRGQLKAGAQLVREWNGVPHTVDVVADGFRYKDQTYASLTAIAMEITGAHWSGPRFFGMRAKS